jgi:hypothetical protein
VIPDFASYPILKNSLVFYVKEHGIYDEDYDYYCEIIRQDFYSNQKEVVYRSKDNAIIDLHDVYGDNILFTLFHSNDGKIEGLYNLNIRTKNTIKIIGKPQVISAHYDNGTVHFGTWENEEYLMYVTDAYGENVEKVMSLPEMKYCFPYSFNNGWVYYFIPNPTTTQEESVDGTDERNMNQSEIWRIPEFGGKAEKVLELQHIDFMLVSNSKIYIVAPNNDDEDTDYSVFVYNIETKLLERIIANCGGSIDIENKWIYYYEIDGGSSRFCRNKSDGSDFQYIN